jgi:replicative DNA helicase
MKIEVPDFKEYIHYDKQMECAVLGVFLFEKYSYERVMGILTIESFYLEANQKVFSAIKTMWEKQLPIDLLTVCQYMVRTLGIDNLGGDNVPYYLTRLTNMVTGSTHLEYHSFLIRQLYAEREMLKIKYGSMGEGDVLVRSKRMQDELLKLSQFKITNDWEDMLDGVLELHKHMDNVKDKDLIGVPTGFSKVDTITGGLIAGQLIVIAARPSVGKSALLNAMVLNAANKGVKVGIISLEMPTVQIAARMGAVISEVEFYKIYRNKMYDEKERDVVYHGLEKLSNLPIKITDKTGVNISDIRAKVAQLVNRQQLDVLFIDYLQLVDGDGSNKNYNREQEVARLTKGLKIMSMEYNIPIVILAQLNREAAKEKKPQLHHLRESGAIEQDADVVMFLHRDWKVGVLQNEQGHSTEYEADLILSKTRNGETPEIKIGFIPSQMRFYDLDKPPSPTTTSNYYEKDKKDDLPF